MFFAVLRYRLRLAARRARERATMRVAWLLPHEVVRWCYLRVASHATTGKYGNTVVPEIGMMDALGRWDTSNLEGSA
jgi:hypothetical protein